MEDPISNFFNVVFGTDYPGLLAIWIKQTQATKFFKNDQLKKMQSYIKKNVKSNDLYFGCGLLEDKIIKGRGKTDDVIAIPGVWLDIDIQSDAHSSENCPPTREEAFKVLSEFSLEPTIIINSGHGVHLYWLFDNPWQFENASKKDTAAKLLRLFQQTIRSIFSEHGYHLDNTGDLARILRIPGTLNHKKNPPVPVEILPTNSNSQRRYAPKDILEAIKKSKQRLRLIQARMDFPESNGKVILKHCQWFKHCQTDSQTLSEPEWFAMLTVAAFCKDADSLACELSKNYAGYDEQETLDKVSRIQKANYNSVACATIKKAEYYNGYCNNCPHNVKSPFLLGLDKSSYALEQIGFYFDKNGYPRSINGNVFARYILKRFNLLYTRGERFYKYVDGVWHLLEYNELSRLLRDLVHEFVPNFWTTSLEEPYFEALKREAPYEPELNNNRNFLNLLNGMLNLETFHLEPHHPDYHSTTQVPISFEQTAQCPKFNQFILDIFEGDQERIRVVQEIFGYCLTSETSAQKAFLFYGNGQNGKSLLAEILMSLCGEQNTSAIPLSDLENSFNRYELVGKLLNMATENEISSAGLNTAPFKTIVSGDPIQVEKKFEQSFMYRPFCKLVFSLNNLPYSRDKSWGFQRRLVIIPFNKTYREDDPVTEVYAVLKERLLKEMDGILIWALAGLKRLRENKYRFSHSVAIAEFQDEYLKILNPYKHFIEDMIQQGDETDHIPNEEMIKVFTKWCISNHHTKLSNSSILKIHNEIRNALKDIKIKFDVGKGCKVRKNRGYKNIRLKVINAVEQNSDFSDLED